MNNNIRIAKAIIVVILIFIVAIPAEAIKPVETLKAPAMGPGHQHPGSVTGRVTTTDGNYGVPNAYVAIVNALNASQAYYVGQTDANGNYIIIAVNSTAAGSTPYRTYANHTAAGEALSSPFGVEENSTATANVVLATKPVKIAFTSAKYDVLADSSSRVAVTVYVTDALGFPVANGTRINFLINHSDWLPASQGSLSANGEYNAFKAVYNVPTSNGRATVTFGWVNRTYAGNSSTITASCADDGSVYASTSVYFSPLTGPGYRPGEISGTVVNPSGTSIQNALVTLREMGYYPNGTVHEIVRLTTMTSTDQPYPGTFTFRQVSLNNSISYVFMTAEIDIGDGIIYRGTSQNYTLMNLIDGVGGALIVLNAPVPDEVRLAAQPETIAPGGNRSVLVAQLYLHGKPYRMAGWTVNFSGDNDSIGYLPSYSINTTDRDGYASIALTSGDSEGNVSVSATAKINFSYILRGSCVVQVGNQDAGNGTTNGTNASPTDTPRPSVSSSPTTPAGGTPTTSATNPPTTPVSGAVAVTVVLLVLVLLAGVGLAAYYVALWKK